MEENKRKEGCKKWDLSIHCLRERRAVFQLDGLRNAGTGRTGAEVCGGKRKHNGSGVRDRAILRRVRKGKADLLGRLLQKLF